MSWTLRVLSVLSDALYTAFMSPATSIPAPGCAVLYAESMSSMSAIIYCRLEGMSRVGGSGGKYTFTKRIGVPPSARCDGIMYPCERVGMFRSQWSETSASGLSVLDMNVRSPPFDLPFLLMVSSGASSGAVTV